MIDYTYEGGELQLFRDARRWKSYLAKQLTPHLTGQVLEVGAGIGGTTRALWSSRADAPRSGIVGWTCLEPDGAMAARLRQSLADDPLPVACAVQQGTLRDLDSRQRFGTVLYIDVLEHIEDDRGELLRASQHLQSGGRLVVVAPAHQWLFSHFDRAIGHYRRYSARSLQQVVPSGLERLRLVYLDSIGMFASLANRWWLKSALPSAKQVRFWDRLLVPASRVIDPILGRRMGKSLLGVWKKDRSP